MAEMTALEFIDAALPYLIATLILVLFVSFSWLRGRGRRRAQGQFLRELPQSRSLQVREGRTIWKQIDRGWARPAGEIEWIVVDVDLDRGRALVRPARRPRSIAVITGQDLGTGDYFLMPVPPRIRSLPEAMAWAWGVPKRAFRPGNLEEH